MTTRYYICHKQITKIPSLPEFLQELNCCSNQITKLENLPENLQVLHCYSNQITKLENLPNTLLKLDCSNNQITKLENLPNTLLNIYYDYRKIRYIDNLKIRRFNKGNFDLYMYQTFKRLQRHIRYRFNKKNKAATVIQNGLRRWLWEPTSRDGKIGINLRNGLQLIRGESLLFYSEINH